MIRRIAVVFAVTAMATLATVARPVAAAPTGLAIQQLGACLSGGGPGDLLLLMDQSGSLGDTDPDGMRATAAAHLLDQLTMSSSAAGTKVAVAIAGFDVTYQKVTDWTPLNTATAGGLRRSVEAFRNRHSGVDTDYVAALDGARGELRARARGQSGRCQAVIWFTDGKFDLTPRDSDQLRKRYGVTKPYAPGVRIVDQRTVEAAKTAGRTTLCRSGGVADQFRATGAVVIAEGLGSPTSADFGFLHAIAEGTDGAGASCGQVGHSAVGEFRLASDLDDLLFAFDAIGDPRQPPTSATVPVCSRVLCDAGRHTIVLDPSVRYVHVLAGTRRAGVQVVLQGPGGQSVTLAHGKAPAPTVAGQRLTARWLTDRTVDISINRGDEQHWRGAWHLTFLNPTGGTAGDRGTVQLRITSDLVPALTATSPAALHSGDSATLTLGLASEVTHAAVAAADILGSATVRAQFRPPTGAPTQLSPPVDVHNLAAPITLSLVDVQPGPATLRLTLTLRTAAAPASAVAPAAPGTQLADRVVDVPLTVLPPVNFPQVAPRIDFGRAEGAGPLHARLAVTGPGCVWIAGATLTAAPDGVGTPRVTAEDANSASQCLAVAKGAKADLPLQLTLERPGTGTVAGTVSVRLAPDGAPERAVTTTVPYLADVVKPPAAAVRTTVLIMALLIGLGIPLLLLYVLKWWSARIPGIPLLAGLVPATVTDGGTYRDGVPFSFDHNDVDFTAVSTRGTRRLDLPGGVALRTKAGWQPTSAGRTVVRAPGHTILTAGGTTPRLPLTVHNTWLALADTPPGERSDILVLVSGTAGPETYERLAQDIRAKLPRLLADARAKQPGAPPPAGPSGDWLSGADAAAPQPKSTSTAADWWS